MALRPRKLTYYCANCLKTMTFRPNGQYELKNGNLYISYLCVECRKLVYLVCDDSGNREVTHEED